MARDNPRWGYDRIQGALANLGIVLSDSSIGNILKEHGIEPAPKRGKQLTWKTFLQSHWDALSAIDFTSVEVWTGKGLVTFYVLIAMNLKTRRIEVAGVTENPDGQWTQQVTRNLTGGFDGLLSESTHLIMDRDSKFLPLKDYLECCSNMTPVMLPPRSPNLNAYIERYMRSMKEECLDNMIFFGRGMLEHALKEWSDHYHHERNHQGLDNTLIDPMDGNGSGEPVKSKERLGGMLRYYYREAA
jgi:transposase InsO family protein